MIITSAKEIVFFCLSLVCLSAGKLKKFSTKVDEILWTNGMFG